MEQIHDRVAGLDVHRDVVAACVRVPGPRGKPSVHKQRFSSTSAGLAQLADWLTEHDVALVAMEATGVYWKVVYYALETRFVVWLCNAHHVKNVPGRKTDMSDAEWLADVAAHGMVRPSFVPRRSSESSGTSPGIARARSTSEWPRSSGWRRSSRTPESSSPRWRRRCSANQAVPWSKLSSSASAIPSR